MVTETDYLLNDRNNNTVNMFPSRTSLSKEKESVVQIDENSQPHHHHHHHHHHQKGKNNDTVMSDDDDNSDKNVVGDDDTDEDENIDVGVEKSSENMDEENPILSEDSESPDGGDGNDESPRLQTHDSSNEDHPGFRTSKTTTTIPRHPINGDISFSVSVSASSLPPRHPHPPPPPLPSLLHRHPQSLSLFHSHRLPPPPPAYHHLSPPASPTTNTNNNNNNNNNKTENNNRANDRKSNSCSPTPPIIKTNFINKLSFGIDRILNETNNSRHNNNNNNNNDNNNIRHHSNHNKQTITSSARGRLESNEDTSNTTTGKELDSPSQDDLSDQDEAEDYRKQQQQYILSAYHNRLTGYNDDLVASSKVTNHTVASSAAAAAAAAAANKSCLPPRMLPTAAVDLVSPLNPFHGAVLSPRVEAPSLDILPVRPAWPDVYVCPWTGVQRDRFGLVRRVGHPYQNRTPPKRKKPRTAFSRQQVLELEKRFTRQKYLASAERSALAKTLSMTDAQVKTWFQNRRTKWRRQTAEEREIERQAAHKFLLSLRPDDPSRANMAAYGAICGVNQQGLQQSSEGPKSPGASSVN